MSNPEVRDIQAAAPLRTTERDGCMMNQLLSRILDAHGGTDRWREYEKVEATIVSGGGFFALKGMISDATPRRMTAWLHEERSSVCPYGKPDQRTMSTPDRIAIEKLDGTLVSERHAPRDSFAGHQMSTPWDALHLAYFNSEALWTYFTTPFLLAMDGTCRGRRTVAGGRRNLARITGTVSRLPRDAQPHSGVLLRSRFTLATARL